MENSLRFLQKELLLFIIIIKKELKKKIIINIVNKNNDELFKIKKLIIIDYEFDL